MGYLGVGAAIAGGQPIGGNRGSIERAHRSTHLLERPYLSDKVIKFGTVPGELQIEEQYVKNQTVPGQLICMTVTLVEREKRRQHKPRGEEGTALMASLITHPYDPDVDRSAHPHDDGIIR